jgi:hypothetical protein
MRKIKVLKVNPTTAVPGSIEIAGNFVQMFQGRFFRNAAGQTLPAYTVAPPSTYSAIVATTFDLVENSKYSGRYTVYTPASAVDTASSSFSNSKTTISVNEVIGPLVAGDSAAYATDGYLTNISTYLISTGTADIFVPPGTINTTLPVEILGRNVSGWGEVFAQNFVSLARTFAQSAAPTNPLVGQQWFDTDDGQVRVWNGATWDLLNKASFGSTFKHTQSTPATTWTVNHGLALAAPFIAFVQFFVDRGDGPKMIIPSDVTFVTANQLTVTFSNAEIGYVLVRP